MKKIPFELHKEVYTPKDIAKVLSLSVNEKSFPVTIAGIRGQKDVY